MRKLIQPILVLFISILFHSDIVLSQDSYETTQDQSDLLREMSPTIAPGKKYCLDGACTANTTPGTGVECGSNDDCQYLACSHKDGGSCVKGGFGTKCSASQPCKKDKEESFCSYSASKAAMCVPAAMSNSFVPCTDNESCSKKTSYCNRSPSGALTCGGYRGGSGNLIRCGNPEPGKPDECSTIKTTRCYDGKCEISSDRDAQRCDDSSVCARKRCSYDTVGLGQVTVSCGTSGSQGKSCESESDCASKFCQSNGLCVYKLNPEPADIGCSDEKPCAQPKLYCKKIEGGGVVCNSRTKNGTGIEARECEKDDDCRRKTTTSSTSPEEPEVSGQSDSTLYSLDAKHISEMYGSSNNGLSSFSIGSKDAPVKISVFQDLKCGMAKKASLEVLPNIISKYVNSGKVLLTFFEFPLIAGEETQFAKSALCAAQQNKYLDYTKFLYENMKTTSINNFSDYAKKLHLDVDDFLECIKSSDTISKLNKQISFAKEIGVQGTPTFFINGVDRGGYRSYDEISVLIEDALKLTNKDS